MLLSGRTPSAFPSYLLWEVILGERARISVLISRAIGRAFRSRG